MKRVREMRDRGEEPSPEIRAKLRELFQSGAIQRPAGGGGRGGGMGEGGGGGGGRPQQRQSQPAWRNVYTLVTKVPTGGGEPVSIPQQLRVKTGISDGAYTEITEGLKEGDVVVTAVKLPASQQPAAPPQGASPFGGGGGGRRF